MLLLWLVALLGLCPVEAAGQGTSRARPTPGENKSVDRSLAVFRSKEARRPEFVAAMQELVTTGSAGVRARLLDEVRKTSEEGVLYWTCRALVEMKEGEVVPILIKRIQEPRGPASPRAVGLLGEAGDRRAVQPLVKIIRSPSERSPRAEALLALGRLAGPEEVTLIIESLDHKDYYVRKAAGEALGGLASAPERAEAAARLIAAKIRKTEKDMKPALIRLLGKLDSPTARAEVRDYLRFTGEHGILRAALHAAGDLKIKEAAEQVLDVVHDEDQPRHMRELAVETLAAIEATEEMDELVSLLEGDEAYLREAANQALGRLAGKSLPPSADVWRSAVVRVEEEEAAGGAVELNEEALPETPALPSAADEVFGTIPTSVIYVVIALGSAVMVVGLFLLRAAFVRRRTAAIEAGRRKIRRRASY